MFHILLSKDFYESFSFPYCNVFHFVIVGLLYKLKITTWYGFFLIVEGLTVTCGCLHICLLVDSFLGSHITSPYSNIGG